MSCHNDIAPEMESVVMPSRVEISTLGRQAPCMQCHQVRESARSIRVAIALAGVSNNAVSQDPRFIDAHHASAAIRYGSEAPAGLEYADKVYIGFFEHVDGVQACQDCHDPHTLEVKFEGCEGCHADVASAEDAQNLRMPVSRVDYDGDDDLSEGVYHEIIGLQERLYDAIQTLALDVAGEAIFYDRSTPPFFFNDTDGAGVADRAEVKATNG